MAAQVSRNRDELLAKEQHQSTSAGAEETAEQRAERLQQELIDAEEMELRGKEKEEQLEKVRVKG